MKTIISKQFCLLLALLLVSSASLRAIGHGAERADHYWARGYFQRTRWFGPGHRLHLRPLAPLPEPPRRAPGLERAH